MHITDTAEPQARRRLHITDTAEPQKATKQLTGDDLRRAAAERFPEWLREVARQIIGFGAAAETAALLPLQHMRVDEDAEMIMRFLDEFRRARRDQRPDLKVVGGSSGGGTGGVGGEVDNGDGDMGAA